MQAKTNRFILSLVLVFFMSNTAGHSFDLPQTPVPEEIMSKCRSLMEDPDLMEDADLTEDSDLMEDPDLVILSENFLPQAELLFTICEQNNAWSYSVEQQAQITAFVKKMAANMDIIVEKVVPMDSARETDKASIQNHRINIFIFGYLSTFTHWLINKETDPECDTKEARSAALNGFVYCFGVGEGCYQSLDEAISYLLENRCVLPSEKSIVEKVSLMYTKLTELITTDKALSIKLALIGILIKYKYQTFISFQEMFCTATSALDENESFRMEFEEEESKSE